MDINLDDDGNVGNNRRYINDDELLSDHVNQVPATNYGELAYIFYEKTQYCRTFGNITIYGHVLISQCGTLLTQNNFHIKGSSLHMFLFKVSVLPFMNYQYI